MKLGDTENEAYEMGEQVRDADGEPLLPRYERQVSSSPLHIQVKASPQTSTRRILSCVCVALLILIPWSALAGCWAGKKALSQVRDWDALPDEWKSWLEDMVPTTTPGAAADPVNFPTK